MIDISNRRSEQRNVARPPCGVSRRIWCSMPLSFGGAVGQRGISIKMPLKYPILFPHSLKGGIDTTILWVGGYAPSRYMNAQTLYVSQTLGIVHGLRCRAPTLSSSRRARASLQNHAPRRDVRIPSNNPACMQSKEIVLSSHFRRNRYPGSYAGA